MKTIALAYLLAAATVTSPGPEPAGRAKLNVVATTPDLAAIARAIGGDAVDVVALAKPTEDPHFVDAKPSHIVRLNRADVLIEGGAELELGWLPALLESSRNARIAAGAPGRVVASVGITMIEVPVSFDRSKGDVHSMGNPHFLLDPINTRIVAAQIARHFAQVSPGSVAVFEANLAQFTTTLEARLAQWRRQLAPHRGARIVTYHKDFAYLAERFGLEVVATLEPMPGIAPSPAHLARVIGMMRAEGARVILVQPYQNRRTAETVARQADGVVVDAPQQPGVLPHTDTYFELMDYLVRSLVTALGEVH